MKIYTGLIKYLGCRCFYYNSGMNIPLLGSYALRYLILVLYYHQRMDYLIFMNI